MSASILAIISIPVTAVFIGWLYGRNHLDPNTPEGRRYYKGSKSQREAAE